MWHKKILEAATKILKLPHKKLYHNSLQWFGAILLFQTNIYTSLRKRAHFVFAHSLPKLIQIFVNSGLQHK